MAVWRENVQLQLPFCCTETFEIHSDKQLSIQDSTHTTTTFTTTAAANTTTTKMKSLGKEPMDISYLSEINTISGRSDSDNGAWAKYQSVCV